MEEAAVETEIQAKGLNAPRITPEHPRRGDQERGLPRLPLHDADGVLPHARERVHGHGRVGLCASPANFNAELGRKIARGHARDKIWALEGYLLKQSLSEKAQQVA